VCGRGSSGAGRVTAAPTYQEGDFCPVYRPREQWSPSSLAHAARCFRSYGFRYFEGSKEVKLTWPEAEALPEPPKAPRGASEIEKKRAKEARKLWNKRRRPALGGAGHSVIEAYFAQNVPGYWRAPMVWRDLGELFTSKPGQIVVPGLGHLPDPKQCLDVLIEDPIRIDFRFLPADLRAEVEADPLRFSGFKDLVVVTTAGVRLIDHKTTYDFAWCKTPETLAEDEQANLYALDVMQRFGLESLECTWVYYRTEGAPAAHAVHFTITRAAAEAVVVRLVRLALELRLLMRACPRNPTERRAYIQSLAANTDACADFGGRDCHADRGGPCAAKAASLGKQMRDAAKRRLNLITQKQTQKEQHIMALTTEEAARMAELKAKKDGGTADFGEKRALAALEKKAAEDGGAAPAASADPTSAPAATEAKADEAPAAAPEKPVQTTVAPPPKPAKAKPDAPASSADTVSVQADGVTVEVPKSSPLYKAVVKVCKARAAFDAAMAGDL